MRLIFAGTPPFSVAALHALHAAGHDICAVYTQPDRPSGRGQQLTASAVKQAALALNLPVYQPLNFKSEEALTQWQAHEADVAVVVAYGLILPQAVLDAPRQGCLNIHASLLPRWRGAAPIQRAILAGDAETGITIMQMEAGLDTGPMLYTLRTPITEQDTAQTLHDTLSPQGAQAIVTVLDALAAYQREAIVQDHTAANYAHKLTKAEAQINWNLSAEDIVRAIRGYHPTPVAWALYQGAPLRIWNAVVAVGATHNNPVGTIFLDSLNRLCVGCGKGAIILTEIQLAGGKRVVLDGLKQPPL